MFQRLAPPAAARQRRAHARAWPGLFLAALALRLACLALPSPAADGPNPVAPRIESIARSLAGGGGFAMPSAGRPVPTALVPPLAPWLLGVAYRVAGDRALTPRLLWCLLGALVPLLTVWLGSSLFGSRAARAAGWACALDPLLVLRGPSLAQETALGVTLMLALGLGADWIKTPRRGRALGLGIAWGLCSLASAAALPLLLVVAAWAWIPLGLTLPSGERWRQIGLVALGAGAIVLPWTARNAIVLHAAAPVTTSAGLALLAGNNAEVWDTPALRGAAVDILAREPYGSPLLVLHEGERDRRAAVAALRFLSGRIRDWPRTAAARLARMWDPRLQRTEPAGSAGSVPVLDRVMRRIDPVLGFSIVLYPLALWGLFRAASGPRRWFQSLPTLMLAYPVAVALVFFGTQDARVPVEPLALLIAAHGLDDLRRRVRSRRHGLRVIDGRTAATG